MDLHNRALTSWNYISCGHGSIVTYFSWQTKEKAPMSVTTLRLFWSGRRDSNSRPSPWQGDALPLSHFRTLFIKLMVEGGGFEPPKAQLTDLQSAPFGHSGIPRYNWSWWRESNPQPADYKSAALPLSHTSILFPFVVWKKLAIRNGLEPSTSSVTGWHSNQLNYRTAIGGSNRARTCDPLLVRQMLSQLSYTPPVMS